MATTIRDIAKAANVSVSTVSLVLRGKEARISPNTRQRVLEIAEQLHYVPNQVAVSLVTKRTYTIGLIYADMLNPLYAELVVGLERTAQSRGYSLLICNCAKQADRCIKNIDLLESRCIDGFILQPPNTINSSPADLKALQDRLAKCTIPYVLVDYAVHDVFHDYVAADHQAGGAQAAEFLVGLGHTRIGCITGSRTDYGTIHRLEGFRRVLAAHNIPFDSSLIYSGGYQVESGHQSALELFQRDVTAIFAFSDTIALGVQRAAAQRGISIPRDLSLIGYDDSIYANLSPVPLTTIRQPIEVLGSRACEILLDRVSDPDRHHQDYLYPPVLIQRASCSIPRPEGTPLPKHLHT